MKRINHQVVENLFKSRKYMAILNNSYTNTTLHNAWIKYSRFVRACMHLKRVLLFSPLIKTSSECFVFEAILKVTPMAIRSSSSEEESLSYLFSTRDKCMSEQLAADGF